MASHHPRYGRFLGASLASRPLVSAYAARSTTHDLLAARKGRDALAVRVLRSAIATLENAEATPTDVRAGAVEAVALGVGTAEAERLVVGDDEARRLLRADHDDRVHLADTADTHGRAEEATQLRAEAGVLARYLS